MKAVSRIYAPRQDEFSDILPRLLPECIDQSSLTSGLIAACKAGCIRAARLLVSKGGDVNVCYEEGNSPLYAAIRARSSQVVAFLLNAGADPNIANNETQHCLCILHVGRSTSRLQAS